MSIQVLEIKKSKNIGFAEEVTYKAVVYLYLVNYGRTKPEEVAYAISGFLSVSFRMDISSEC